MAWIKYSSTPLEYDRAPPMLGEDTDYVLSELLDMDEAQIAELRSRGTI